MLYNDLILAFRESRASMSCFDHGRIPKISSTYEILLKSKTANTGGGGQQGHVYLG